MSEEAKVARWWATGAAWWFGFALSGALGVPFWRDAPYGDGFDLSLTCAFFAWFLVGAVRRPFHVTRVMVDRTGVTILEEIA